ncbi:transcription factor bHLH115-like [Canna indica]|uniref:Transcription factor bHLH115-like n=1 Tax=Canna indica TaxID=4628 RepID=A0AAQ3Q5Q2_9LILI|nr:transcription factor bHLH115-like [Canna indica]
MPLNQSNGGGGWLIDYGGTAEEVRASGFIWTPQIVDDPSVSSAMLGFEVLQKEDNSSNNGRSKKRTRWESSAAPGTKARREKIRRDRLNDRFTELCSIMDPGKPPKTDKFVILSDATRLLNQLRSEARKLKESNEALQVAMKNLKSEKLELRDEKMKLKTKKEQIEQTLKATNTTQFATQPDAAAFHAASVAADGKTLPHPNYLPIDMWQWIPPASLDTSLDHVLRPPVA